MNDKKRTYLQLVDDYDRVSEEEYSSVCFLPDESREYSADQEEKKEKLRIIKEALKSLTKRQRQVVEMYYGEGKTQREIATLMGLKQRTVSHHIEDAEKKVKLFLLRYG